MARVLHTGDTHIGYRQYNAPERREDFLRAFEAVVEDAIADGVDAVVHAGDLFHDRRPALPALQGTVGALRRLAEADVPFLAVVGNHEGTRDTQWLDLFEGLGIATRLGREPVVVDGVAFYGLDYVPRSRRDDLEYDFQPSAADRSVLVAHGLFEPFPHADWDTGAMLEAATVDFDAVLLGDYHEPETACLDGTRLAYCGSTERTSTDERDPRGYNLVTLDEDVRIARRGLEAAREFVFVDVDLGPGEGAERVREQVGQHDLSEAVVVVTIEGAGEAVTPAAIEEFADEAGALLARVTDRREREASETEPTVTFADPDAAVDERVRELGLSAAALSIDGTVRDGDVATTNVRERVRSRMETMLEEDPSAFEGAADDSESDRAEGPTGDPPGGTDGGEDGREQALEDGDGPGDGPAPTGENGAVADDPRPEEPTEPVAGEPGRDEPDDEDPIAREGEATSEDAPTASLEDFQ